jgi:hypothetical protein
MKQLITKVIPLDDLSPDTRSVVTDMLGMEVGIYVDLLVPGVVWMGYHTGIPGRAPRPLRDLCERGRAPQPQVQ